MGSQVRGLILAELITGAVLLALLGLGGRWLIGRGLAPLDRMASTADVITSRGDLTARMPDPGDHAEAGRLAAAINTMLDRIQQAFGARWASEQKVRQFAADASHELRTPLTTIRGYAELYRQGALGPDRLPNAMRRIEQEADRMSSLVAELLELARLDRNSSLDLTDTDMAELVRDAVADAKAVEPDRPISATAPPRLIVVADEPRIRQVLANLLGNVREHTAPGTPVAVRLAQAGQGALLEVSDAGQGMSEEAAARAFDRFYRGGHNGNGNGHGSGLGPVHRAGDRRRARRPRHAQVRGRGGHQRAGLDPVPSPGPARRRRRHPSAGAADAHSRVGPDPAVQLIRYTGQLSFVLFSANRLYRSGSPDAAANYGRRMQDRELVAAIVAGDPGGLAEAYDRYAAPLYAYCRSMLPGPHAPADAASAVADTFIIATAKLQGLRDPDQLGSWLHAVARNECLRQLGAGGARGAGARAGRRRSSARWPAVVPPAGLREQVLTACADNTPTGRANRVSVAHRAGRSAGRVSRSRSSRPGPRWWHEVRRHPRAAAGVAAVAAAVVAAGIAALADRGRHAPGPGLDRRAGRRRLRDLERAVRPGGRAIIAEPQGPRRTGVAARRRPRRTGPTTGHRARRRATPRRPAPSRSSPSPSRVAVALASPSPPRRRRPSPSPPPTPGTLQVTPSKLVLSAVRARRPAGRSS